MDKMSFEDHLAENIIIRRAYPHKKVYISDSSNPYVIEPIVMI